MKYYFFLIISIFSQLSLISQTNESRSTDIKIQRLLFLIDQMYVEKVDSKKIKEDLVIGMYNSLSPIALYQSDDFFKKHQINPLEKTSIGVKIKFKKGKIIIDSIINNSGAKKAGLEKKDILVAINEVSLTYYDEFKDELANYKSEEIRVLVNRGGEELTLRVNVNEDGMLGFKPSNLSLKQLEELEFYNLASNKYGFAASFPAGYNKAIKKLSSYIDQFILILSPSTGAYKGMGGFGAIGSMFPATWNWEVFWNLTAFLSLMLAFMNVLPIPALDGGHVVFLVYEMIVGKPAPEKVMEYAQAIGMIMLLSLLVFANGNDILKLF
jgi:RIP metalloprotease RseP